MLGVGKSIATTCIQTTTNCFGPINHNNNNNTAEKFLEYIRFYDLFGSGYITQGVSPSSFKFQLLFFFG
ncbi:hypothetical protein VNO77_28912 [Canavalia gladiata]|uniref:Uncharacterized protein n=1 Tax=Canavalia gladiata TaxID=3824 RepID=A0AAN9KWK1_CANGL